VSTLIQLRDEVLEHELDRSASRVDGFLNDALRTVARQVRHYTGEASAEITTVAGTSAYDWPSDVGKLRWLLDVDASSTLQVVGLRDIDNAAVTQGRPTSYATAGKTVTLYPTPDAAYLLRMRYWALPPLMQEDGDTPALPDDFHRVLVFYALQRCYELEDDFEVAAYWRGQYDIALAAMGEDLKAPNNDGPRQIPSMWEPGSVGPGLA
jgi:hypothetical protein